MLRIRNFALVLTAGLCMLPFTEAVSQGTEASSQTLKSIGTLNCSASRGETDGRGLFVTALDCRLDIPENPDQKASVEGRLFGKQLAVRKPDEARVVWKVFAPDPAIDPKQLEGDYDIESPVNFELPEDRAQMLVGGKRGLVALQLVEPGLDAINPATRLTLDVNIPEPFLQNDAQTQ